MRSQVWVAAAISAGGRALLVWESQNDASTTLPGPATSRTVAAAASAPENAPFSAAQELASFPPSAAGGPNGAALSEPPVVAAAFDRTRPIAAWTGHDAGGSSVQTADADEAAATTQTLSAPGTEAILGALATAPGRGALMAWLDCRPNQNAICFPISLQAAQAPPGGPFAPAATPSADAYNTNMDLVGAAAAIDQTSGVGWVAAAGVDQIKLFSRPQP
jgi:hypothetical protein